jgi:hypothetical protein
MVYDVPDQLHQDNYLDLSSNGQYLKILWYKRYVNQFISSNQDQTDDIGISLYITLTD